MVVDSTSTLTRKPNQAYVTEEAEEATVNCAGSLHDPTSIIEAVSEAGDVDAALPSPDMTAAPMCHWTDIKPSWPGSGRFGKPKGFYHRIPFRGGLARRRFVYSKPTSSAARFAFTPFRRRYLPFLFGATRERTVSFKCYTRCPMAYGLSGRQSRLQRSLEAARAILEEEGGWK
ncbi:hypothetical protein CC86DRAFT_400700 [Ophiobolus disseminans]|uniref:Uncharacterized protein n=1 Tax=Ophiobolus disseminans TaxID=1469910 RepID=A0A6A7AFB1_9PLEO|nr:hypothetical protein CC86DRAFT_400700 [Ophiobolus disseminans]